MSVLLSVTLLFAACGSDDDGEDATAGGADGISETEDASDTGDGQAADSQGIEAVYAEVEGLIGDERRQRLIELAEAEGGEVVIYTSDIEAVLESLEPQFEADTGIDLQITRLGSGEILTRLIQEDQAGDVGADAILVTQANAWAADSEGLLAPFRSPVTDQLLDDVVQDNFAGVSLALLVAAWNTNAVAEGETPETWEEVYTNFKGNFGFDFRDYYFFAELVKHFMSTNGWSEDEAVDFLVDAAEGARAVRGHSTLQNLLNQGEFAMAAGQFNLTADVAANEGAPVAWKPPVTPIVAVTAPVAVPVDAPHPAGGLLFSEYRLQEGQQIAFEASNLIGSNPNFSPGVEEVAGVSEDDIILTTREVEFTERDRWEGLYQRFIDAAG